MKLLENLSGAKVLVVGDVMLDRYWWGSVSRISPEAPVPVVRLARSTAAAGGAANVAANIAGLGAQAMLVGSVGADAEAGVIHNLLSKSRISGDHLLEIKDRPTTVKTRIIAHSQQIARVDQEIDDELDEEKESHLLDHVSKLIDRADVIVVSDYAKGLLTANVLSGIVHIAKNANKKLLVDPKGKNYSKYSGATLLTPNRREAAESCGFEDTDKDVVNLAGNRLMMSHDFDAVLITEGDQGMTLFNGHSAPKHFSAAARAVFDVTGAGDTVIATLGTMIAAGADFEQAAELANVAAGIVVEQVGTTTIKFEELNDAVNGRRSTQARRA
jgi:rfaE bifunctional protein kinase chain/domain